ncbi:hypothetical protein CEXT_459291 [Caerostris extrusa]|uniref:Uncharacterized protein n=1 Tax=Caerostris extrusa TaxID=172846 RepID=A0AAV4Q8S2_CAEEX|nr:hypothetical protein CEXT_459291 [Caerostris extrusa]
MAFLRLFPLIHNFCFHSRKKDTTKTWITSRFFSPPPDFIVFRFFNYLLWSQKKQQSVSCCGKGFPANQIVLFPTKPVVNETLLVATRQVSPIAHPYLSARRRPLDQQLSLTPVLRGNYTTIPQSHPTH